MEAEMLRELWVDLVSFIWNLFDEDNNEAEHDNVVDPFMNLVLADAVEFTKQGQQKQIGKFYILSFLN